MNTTLPCHLRARLPLACLGVGLGLLLAGSSYSPLSAQTTLADLDPLRCRAEPVGAEHRNPDCPTRVDKFGVKAPANPDSPVADDAAAPGKAAGKVGAGKSPGGQPGDDTGAGSSGNNPQAGNSGGDSGIGNPGNNKDVGKAGEAPSGDPSDWGGGTRGKGDVAHGNGNGNANGHDNANSNAGGNGNGNANGLN